MKSFTKLFSSITSSSIWRAPDHVRLVWITLLAMADKDGEVWASVGGLADASRVSRERCLDALATLMSPDEDSRTKDHDGRRIAEIDGGWVLLNYRKYREMGRSEDRREYFADHKRKSRSQKCPQMSTMSTMSTTCPQMSPIAEAEARSRGEARPNARARVEVDTVSELYSDQPPTQPPPPLNDVDRWRYVQNEEWAGALKRAGAKIGPQNWTVWKALHDGTFNGETEKLVKFLAKMNATERWPDKTEAEWRKERPDETARAQGRKVVIL